MLFRAGQVIEEEKVLDSCASNHFTHHMAAVGASREAVRLNDSRTTCEPFRQ